MGSPFVYAPSVYWNMGGGAHIQECETEQISLCFVMVDYIAIRY